MRHIDKIIYKIIEILNKNINTMILSDTLISHILSKKHTHTETKHYAVAVGGKHMVFGENYIIDGPTGSIHAEHDALCRFIKNIKSTYPITVDILVIRLSKSGVLGCSRPCISCLSRMKKLMTKSIFNINIRYIYYSSERHQIIRERFNTMINNPITYQSSGMRHKVRKWSFGNK